MKEFLGIPEMPLELVQVTITEYEGSLLFREALILEIGLEN